MYVLEIYYELFQIWTGWPMSVNLDDAVLALTGITYPEHNLKVRRAPQKPPNKESKRVNIPNTYKRVIISNTLKHN